MKYRPIDLKPHEVSGILAGRQTQIRREMKPQPSKQLLDDYERIRIKYRVNTTDGEMIADCFPSCYGQSGDRLWGLEAFAIVPRTAYAQSNGVQQTLRADDPYEHDAAIYREGWTRSNGGFRWRSPIHMPRWASRITLEITGVRVERLQDISEADAVASGIEREPGTAHWKQYDRSPGSWRYWESAVQSYRTLYESIYGPDSWSANPWVEVCEFKRVECGAV